MKLKVLLSPKAAREAAQQPVRTIEERVIASMTQAVAIAKRLREEAEWNRAAHQRCCN